MAKLPYMQLYPADFLTAVLSLDMTVRGAYATLLFYIWLNSKDGTVRLSGPELANLWLMEEPKALQTLQFVVASNLVDHTFDAEKNQNIITSRRISRDRKRLESKANWISRQRVDRMSTASRQNVDIKKSEVRSQKSDKDLKDSPSKPVLMDEKFEQFWKAYPRRVGKGAAQKAWKHALAGTAEAFPLILAAVAKQKKSWDWVKDAGQFIPHPATWLNQQRWLDEVQGSPSPGNPATPLPAKPVDPDYQAWLDRARARELAEQAERKRLFEERVAAARAATPHVEAGDVPF